MKMKKDDRVKLAKRIKERIGLELVEFGRLCEQHGRTDWRKHRRGIKQVLQRNIRMTTKMLNVADALFYDFPITFSPNHRPAMQDYFIEGKTSRLEDLIDGADSIPPNESSDMKSNWPNYGGPMHDTYDVPDEILRELKALDSKGNWPIAEKRRRKHRTVSCPKCRKRTHATHTINSRSQYRQCNVCGHNFKHVIK